MMYGMRHILTSRLSFVLGGPGKNIHTVGEDIVIDEIDCSMSVHAKQIVWL